MKLLDMDNSFQIDIEDIIWKNVQPQIIYNTISMFFSLWSLKNEITA